ncbi:MAG TPA: glycosyltransferase family 4 protein [Polyangiaceae bacterium]|nr:glycosyltransferase family 4 protein [Polyangiaceae bacterium]
MNDRFGQPKAVSASKRRRVAVVYAVPAGSGGLGLHVATVIAALSRQGHEVFALGPGSIDAWPLTTIKDRVRWVAGAPRVPNSAVRYTPLRFYPGGQTWLAHGLIGRWAARELDKIRPDLVYLFTQVALEGLQWCRTHGVPSIVDNPNGGIANYRAVCKREWDHWCSGPFPDHPVPGMVERVHEEYALANRIRVSSTWAAASTAQEVDQSGKIVVVDLPVNLERFRPPPLQPSSSIFQIVMVGSLDVRKGFLYLLRAVRRLQLPLRLLLVGGTGSRQMKLALRRESNGLDVVLAPGDPVAAYHSSDISVLPSMEDGFGFVVAEAMACGLATIVTNQSGSAQWVRDANAGWVVPAGQDIALAEALSDAYSKRVELREMGVRARSYVEQRASDSCLDAVEMLITSLLSENS